MTDDLQAKFAVLTEARPEPSDPAAPVRLRIKRRQRRRRGTAVVLVTAAAVTATLAVGPALGALRSGPADSGGFAGPPTAQPSTAWSQEETKVLPPPWSDKKFTKMPDANAYRPAAYYVAQGKIPTESWAILSVDDACVVADEGSAVSFGRPYDCFYDWPAGRTVNYSVTQAYAKEKNSSKVDHSLILGVVSIEARRVRIVAGGKTYLTDAVGTPTTDHLRFFAIEIPKRDLKVASITPLDAAGRPAPAPRNPPVQICVSISCTATSGITPVAK
jgi:hypothetical protein